MVSNGLVFVRAHAPTVFDPGIGRVRSSQRICLIFSQLMCLNKTFRMVDKWFVSIFEVTDFI